MANAVCGQDSPDLRVIWLNNLAQDLKSRGAFEEAAQCKFNVAALVIGYMALLKPHEAVAIDVASAFQYDPAALTTPRVECVE